MSRWLTLLFLVLIAPLHALPARPRALALPVAVWADDFGALPNDTLDDTRALQAALDSLAAWACQIGSARHRPACERPTQNLDTLALFTLHLRPGVYRIRHPLRMDFFNLRLEGHGALLKPTPDFQAGHCPPAVLILYSSGRWIGTHGSNLRGRENWAVVRDLSLIRPEDSPARIGLWIGYPRVDTLQNPDGTPGCLPRTLRNAFLKVEQVTLYNFPRAVQFGNHTWRITFEKCHFHNNTFAVFASDSMVAGQTSRLDFGENLTFEGCLFSGTRLWLNTGAFAFSRSSFLYSTLEVSGDAIVSLVQCHLENPGVRPPEGYFARVLRGRDYRNRKRSAFLSLDQCRIVVSPVYPDTFLRIPLFYVDSVQAGLILRDTYLPRTDNYQPQDSGGLRVLVAGPGPVVASGLRDNNAWGARYVIAKSLNALLNGDAEAGLQYWQGHGTGLTRDGAYRGRQSFQLAPGGSLRQRIPVQPFQRVWSHLVYRIQGSGSLRLTFRYLRPRGSGPDSVLKTVRYTLPARPHWFIYVPPTHRVPPGASAMEFVLEFQGTANSRADVDEIIVNLTD